MIWLVHRQIYLFSSQLHGWYLNVYGRGTETARKRNASIFLNILQLHALSKHIASFGISLTQEEQALLTSMVSERHFRKKQYIVQQGDVVRFETFIVTGLTRTYTIDEGGQEHVLNFGTENHWIGDLYSFFTENPSGYNIDCLEATVVVQLSRISLDKLCLEVPKMNIYFRDLYRNSLIAYHQRVQSSLEKSARERYLEFRSRFPELEQRIPDNQIASLLGITPQSLSRIRKQLL